MKLYKEIPYCDYNRFVATPFVKEVIHSKEITLITDTISEYCRYILNTYNDYIKYTIYVLRNNRSILKPFTDFEGGNRARLSFTSAYLKIFKDKDDWYYVSVDHDGYHEYYRCDQLDGLIQFMHKIINDMGGVKTVTESKNYYEILLNQSTGDPLAPNNHKVWCKSNADTFTQHECDELNRVFEKLNFDFGRTKDRLLSNTTGDLLAVFKTIDEWYYVDFMKYDGDMIHCICDQFDGLIDCIRDVILPHIMRK